VLCCKQDVLLIENDINLLYVLDVISTSQPDASPALLCAVSHTGRAADRE
jgi:hypothetical protein